MLHANTQIRDVVATTLTGLTTTGSRVHTGRVFNVPSVPALSVYTLREELLEDQGKMGSTLESRALTLVVEAHAKGADVDATLSSIDAEVQVALYVDRTLDGFLEPECLHWVGSEKDLSDDHEGEAGRIAIEYRIEYRVDGEDPTVILT